MDPQKAQNAARKTAVWIIFSRRVGGCGGLKKRQAMTAMMRTSFTPTGAVQVHVMSSHPVWLYHWLSSQPTVKARRQVRDTGPRLANVAAPSFVPEFDSSDGLEIGKRIGVRRG